MPVKHSFVSAVPDGPAGDVVRPVDWNAEHVVEGLQLASGFPLDANMAYGVALTYDPGTRKVTLTPTLASFDIYVRGTKITTTGVHESVAHGATAGNYYYYHDGSSFVWSTDPWPFDEAPICYVIWLGADGVGYFELHTTSRDPNIHRVLHFSQGTQVQTRGAITGYTPSTDSDAGVTYAIAETVILDEDIQYTLTELADGGPYTIWWRTTAGAWTYTEGATLPFKYGTYPQWNRISDFTLVDLASLAYCNYYVFATPALETQQQFIIVPGQASYSSLAGAQAESVAGLSFGTLPFQEIAPMYKITLRARNTYGGTAKCMIEAVETLVGTRVSVVSTQVSNHNALTGLQGGTVGEYYHLTQNQALLSQAVGAAFAFAGDGGADGDPGPPGRIGVDGVAGQAGTAGPPGPVIFLEPDPPEDPMMIPGAQGPQGNQGNTGTQTWTTLKQTDNESKTNNTLASSTYMTQAFSSGVTIAVRGKAYLLVQDAAADARYAFTYSGTWTTIYSTDKRNVAGVAAGTDNQTVRVASAIIPSTDVTATATGIVCVEFEFIGITATSGTLAFQFAQVTGSATATILKKGSYMEYMTI